MICPAYCLDHEPRGPANQRPPPIIAFIASAISSRAFFTEGRSCTLLHQAASLGRCSNGALAPKPGKRLVTKKVVGASAQSANVKSWLAAKLPGSASID